MRDIREECRALNSRLLEHWRLVEGCYPIPTDRISIIEAFAHEIRNETLDEAMKAIHCECTRYCDYDKAEEKIQALKDNAEQASESCDRR